MAKTSNSPLANATATITTAQHLDYTKSIAFTVAAVDAFNKSGVSMIAACMVVMIAGSYGAERSIKYKEIKETLETNLQKRGLGVTQVSKYITYALTACQKLFKAEQFGGTIGKALVAKDIEEAHEIFKGYLDRLTKGKNTLEAVGIALELVKAPVTPGSKAEPSGADAIASAENAKAEKDKANRERALKVINADPTALKAAPDTVLKAAEVIGFAVMVEKHVEKLSRADQLLAFKKKVDDMVTARLKALKADKPAKTAKPRKTKATAKPGEVQSEQAETKAA